MDPAPSTTPKPTLAHLQHVVNTHPIIDNHAHNLLLLNQVETVPFESITSEAQGRALKDVFTTLPHLRAARDLCQLYDLPDGADWEEILDQRSEWLRSGPERLFQRCFEGVHSVLVDDGLSGAQKVYPFDYFDRFTQAPSKRIVRIETVAEKVMDSLLADAKESDLKHARYFTDTWIAFTEDFEREIQDAVQDPDVVGFKTVICYRSGLDIEPDYEQAAKAVGRPFERYLERCVRKRKYRIDKKALNDYLVLRTLEILLESGDKGMVAKPMQLHTGLGDNDINLLESNPAYLQPLIESYPYISFVLLHSAYPYTREAGYLATVFSNVYLDVGEVFPMVSRDGQNNILRQALEITPVGKLLYSTDGHFFPETFWLANKQFREVWLELLGEYVGNGDFTHHQAMSMTKDILFNNANTLYGLRYDAKFVEYVEPEKATKFIEDRPSDIQQAPSMQSPIQAHIQPNPPYPHTPEQDDRAIASTTIPMVPTPIPARTQPSVFTSPPTPMQTVYDISLHEKFFSSNPHIQFVYLQWLDYMATTRTRILPIKEFSRLIHAGDRISISLGNLGTLQNDAITPAVNPVGQILIEPDLRSLKRTHEKDPLAAATVFCFWRDEQGKPLKECPRAMLEDQASRLKQEYGVEALCGFEIEVTFLKRNLSSAPTFPSTVPEPQKRQQDPPEGQPKDAYSPLSTTHAWATFSPSQWIHSPMLLDICTAFSDLSIDLLQFHAESGLGQYEFVLAPLSPLQAVDALLQARQVIAQIAELHNARATLHPQPFVKGAGTAAHVHISLNNPSSPMYPDLPSAFFVAGVLHHLPSLCAFLLPEAESYTRVKDDTWTGGTWIAWGTQNRETPLRRINDQRWEMRCLDGFANAYFAIGALLAAGLLGLRRTLRTDVDPSAGTQGQGAVEQRGSTFVKELMQTLELDTPVPPSRLASDEERARYNISRRMPRSLEESLRALRGDMELRRILDGEDYREDEGYDNVAGFTDEGQDMRSRDVRDVRFPNHPSREGEDAPIPTSNEDVPHPPNDRRRGHRTPSENNSESEADTGKDDGSNTRVPNPNTNNNNERATTLPLRSHPPFTTNSCINDPISTSIPSRQAPSQRGIVPTYLAMKRSERDMLDAMREGERRVWLVERY